MTKLEVYNECFPGISPKDITTQKIKEKRKEYVKKYHPDIYENKTAQEKSYAEKRFKEYIPIIQEIEKLKENGTLESELEKERENSRQGNEQSNGSNQAYNQQQNRTNNQEKRNTSFYRKDGNIVTIKFVGTLKPYHLKKYEIRIENPLQKIAKTNFIYADISTPLDNLENLNDNIRSYILNECLSDERLEECIKSQGGYVGKYNMEKASWEHDEEIGKQLNLREINKKMTEDKYCFQRNNGTWLGIHEIGEIEFNSASMYGNVYKIKQYKYYDHSTGMSGIIKGDINIEYLKQRNLGGQIDLEYYSAYVDEMLSSERLQEKEQNFDGYVGTVTKKKDHYMKANHNAQLLKYFQDRANEKGRFRQAHYSNEDIRRTQEGVPEAKRRTVFGRMRDACKAFTEAFRE